MCLFVCHPFPTVPRRLFLRQLPELHRVGGADQEAIVKKSIRVAGDQHADSVARKAKQGEGRKSERKSKQNGKKKRQNEERKTNKVVQTHASHPPVTTKNHTEITLQKSIHASTLRIPRLCLLSEASKCLEYKRRTRLVEATPNISQSQSPQGKRKAKGDGRSQSQDPVSN